MATIDDDDDDYGSDGGFDDLEALEVAERQALLSTQQRTVRLPSYGRSLSEVLRNKKTWQPQQPLQPQQEESFESEKTLQPNQNSDYGFEDEDIIDLDQDPYTVKQPYNPPSAFTGRLEKEAQIQHNRTTSRTYGAPPSQPAPASNHVDVAALQAKIRQIELENERLQNTVQSKTGENAILRQKQDKHAKDADQKISALMQLHAEKDAKKNAELERIKREREKVVTDNRFLEHDLALETGKNRQTQKTLKVGNATRSNSGQRTNLNVTPKKAKVLPYRDGFDDGDLVMLSPSKLRDRSKPSTPKAGAKRKRTGTEVQSPIPLPQLPLSEPKPPSLPPQAQAEARVASDLAIRLAKEQNKARSMQKLQRHHIGESEENLFETLTRFAFPSQPDRKLSTLVFEELSTKSVTNNSGSVPDQCCKILSSLWEQCLAETYYQPLPCIINSMQFILDAERFAFARQYITQLVPLAIATSDLVAIPVARASLNKNQSPKPPAPASTTTAPLLGEPGTSTQAVEAASCIDVSACLALLQGLAEAAAAPDGIAIKEFWRHMKFDFVLLVLMKAQPIRQIVLMLELLQGSALEESFGAILGEEEGGRERQARREVDTVDRLTLLLSESFDVGDSAVKVLDSATVFELRAKVVDVLMSLCLHEHGALLLATHRSAIGRLFKFLHDTINNLYLYTHASDHVPLTRAINDTMKILALLCTGNPNVDVRQKLGALPGGTHVHLLALTRLAFAERVWFERGIEEGTVERAHEMLDEWLSPEEGEGLMMMFGSSGSGDSEM